MIAVEGFSGKRAAVFGLGGSGLLTARALVAGGAAVVAADDKDARMAAATEAGVPTGDLAAADFAAFDALILSPGVPLTHPEPHWSARKAQDAGIEVIGDIELFDRERRRRLPALKLAAITGTNGKSTTTALLGHLLAAMGERAEVGGNIGRPVLDLDPADRVAVVECSSYQIDLAPSLSPDVGLLLNLSPDHIDRHGTFEHYAEVKARLVEASGEAVVGVDDPQSAAIADRLEAAGKPVRRVAVLDDIAAAGRVGARGVVAVGETLHAVTDGKAVEIGAFGGIASLRGRHNAQNAAAAVAMAMALGHAPEAVVPHLASFPGLAHRMEPVGEKDGVLFVNDSKATNAQSARQALSSFSGIRWIAGGVPKAGGITELGDLFGRVRAAYLIGEAAADFAATLDGRVPASRHPSLAAALDAAAADAEAGEVVLLSPACASFDQYRSFEARGDEFRSLVRAKLEAAHG